MPDVNSILLLNNLRSVLLSLEQNPELDQRYAGTCELRTCLREEIERLESRVRSAMEHMPKPSVGVPL